ncbi:MAG: hypothetical protein KDD66_05905 [Bdellovibrionales bacterium]|nr:hypothetical protein [Bdellovibrionales bacterium]
MSKDDLEQPPSGEGMIRFIPTIQYYIRSYGNSAEGNDKKGFETFKMYEAHEKTRRLQTELSWLKSGRVDINVCDNVIGKKRAQKWQSYEHWASLALMWLMKKV